MPSRTRKFRGLRTHGRGMKAGRGAGKQGGRGNAGLHKYKFKSMLLYAPDHFGRHGFRRPPEVVERPRAANVGDLPRLFPTLVQAGAGRATGEGEYVVDLARAGIDRLLGGGTAPGRWSVYVAHASEKARAKVTILAAPPDSSPTA